MKLFGFYDRHDSLPMQERWSALAPAWLAYVPVTASRPVREVGRGISEPDDAMEEELSAYVTKQLDPKEPYAFFGYRDGALLALAIAGKLLQAGMPLPGHLLLAGANPPHVSAGGFGMPSAGREPLPSRFSILAGRQDREVTPERMREWSRYTQGRCHIHSLPGGSAVWATQPEGLIRSCMLILEREYARRA